MVKLTLEEFNKLPETRFPPLIEYVRKRFKSKRQFKVFIDKEAGIKLHSNTYSNLLEEAYEKVGKTRFLSILGIQDEREAELRAYLYDGLYKGLMEAPWAHHLSSLFETITGKTIKLIRKIDKKEPAHILAFSISEKDFTKGWIELYEKNILPPVFHHGCLTVGGLGWLKANFKRYGEYYSEVFSIIESKMTQSNVKIYNYFLNFLLQVPKNPAKLSLSEDMMSQLSKIINEISLRKVEDSLKSLMCLQLIETYLDDKCLVEQLNDLISSEFVKPPKVHHFYERFPFTFSDWIITSYGVFQQSPKWMRDPNEELSRIVIAHCDQKCLEPDLESYKGSYPLKVLEYCIIENPEIVLKKMGLYPLKSIAEELGIKAALKVKDEEELIRLVILKLGFNLPPILSGLGDFNSVLKDSTRRIEKNESLSGIMSDVYGEMERVLRDIAYFHLCFAKKVNPRGSKPEQVESILTEAMENPDKKKTFSKLGFGDLIALIRKLNKELSLNKNLQERYIDAFNRKFILPKEQMEILDYVSPFRVPLFAHNKSSTIKVNSRTCVEIVNKLKQFSDFIRENNVYPKVIRVKNEVTNEYGTHYFNAIDDEGYELTIIVSRLTY